VGVTSSQQPKAPSFQIGSRWNLSRVSSNKYTSTDRVGWLIWHHNFKMAAITSFHAEKCSRLVSAHSVCPAPMQQCLPVPNLQYVHSCLDLNLIASYKLLMRYFTTTLSMFCLVYVLQAWSYFVLFFLLLYVNKELSWQWGGVQMWVCTRQRTDISRSVLVSAHLNTVYSTFAFFFLIIVTMMTISKFV